MRKNKFTILSKINIAAFLSIFLINISPVISQQNDLAMVTGTVKDDLGKSIGMEMRFVTPGQMPAITRSNSDGSYQQVLKQGKKYLPVFKGFMELGGFHFFEIGQFDKYQEFRKDYIVLPIEVGKEVASARFFEPGDTLLSAEGKAFLEIFREFFRINKNINCTCFLSAPTTTFKAKTKTIQVEEKGKLKNKKIKIPAKEVEEEFLKARARQIERVVKDYELPAKVFSFAYEFPKKTGRKKGELPNNVRVVIEKVLKI
jgi:hypothetical protein